MEVQLPGEETHRILVVDDEKSMREFLDIMLSKEGYQVSLAENGEEACGLLEKEEYDLLITDIRMKDVDGIGVLKKAKSVMPDIVVVMISAFATADTAVDAMREGAYDYIPKPFKVSDFKRIVREALASRKPLSDSKGKDLSEDDIYHFGRLIGESSQIRKVYDLIERAGPTKTNVLISGESGTGKELVARAIHRESPRKDRHFVVINCAGPWGAQVAEMAGLTVPISCARVQVAVFRRPEGHQTHPIVMDFINGIYLRPETGNISLVGSIDPAEANDVNDANSPSTTATMDADKTVTAVFTVDSPECGDECHPNFLLGDLNHDCYINFKDMAMLASRWATCMAPECD